MPEPFEQSLDNPATRLKRRRQELAKKRAESAKETKQKAKKPSESAEWLRESRRGEKLVTNPRIFESMDIDPDDPIQRLLYETGIEKPPREFGVVDVEQRFKFRRNELAKRINDTWAAGVARAEQINKQRILNGQEPFDFGIKYDKTGKPIKPKLTRREVSRMARDYVETGMPVETTYIYEDGSRVIAPDQSVNVDHVVPLVKGGSNTPKNMLPLYGEQNMGIGGRTKVEARYSVKPIVTPWYLRAMEGLPDETRFFAGAEFTQPTRAWRDMPSEQGRKVGRMGRLPSNLMQPVRR